MQSHIPASSERGGLSRERALALALIVTTGIVGYLCYRVIVPFLPCLAWALALAIVAHPLHQFVRRWVPQADIAATLSVMIVAILFIAPSVFVTQRLAREATTASTMLQQTLSDGRWRQFFEDHPTLKPAERWIDYQFNLTSAGPDDDDDSDAAVRAGHGTSGAETSMQSSQKMSVSESDGTAGEFESEGAVEGVEEIEAALESMQTSAQAERATDLLTQSLGTLVSGTGWLLMQILITLMTLFYFFRDRRQVLSGLRTLLPLTNSETDDIYQRADDTVHATIYGSVVVAMVQGGMGGLMFWWLDLPTPILWGFVMALLAVVPMLGTFVIWVPVSLFLALRGDWTKALILAAWGAIAIGLIDNVLYPLLVGKRLRFHSLLVFFAIVGGLMLFGASGVILGPLLLSSADALHEIWRRRTAYGGTIEEGADAA